ncbi:TonB-dependent receptor [Cytophaga sp. FL35]|uniref:SusC/RagA family TonB-linked outer membrane protein n=1 Tax=Cytophaga sp. FL35 TaxID=1904456 RepID=UPI000C8C7577|nr:TonB-dependent receptor [Cytophaga sp. FL35]MBC6999841.1 TonB-dependent receptor [Cytophaga sp. FL35]MBG47434.1 SusC/RagA family TonB-linked outer membrane protein [Pseudozobellia sp.]|tara:strand:- start:124604 stop:127750 length:3147 start_codon:yes stop_codon:yes gene_type:complete
MKKPKTNIIEKILVSVFLVCAVMYQGYGQDAPSVTGTVTAASDGAPLPGVSIIIKNTTTGVTTDFDGNYTVNAPADATLIFSYIGFQRLEVPVNGQATVDVQMNEDVAALDEVVVTGYSTQDKKSITAAISTVTSEDLENVHAGASVSSGLAGKISGVTFKMPDGRPGATATVQIRNMGNPLYIIDGIQSDVGQFNNISPGDIESISVLKDAAAAIYGVRAANGVVVVTTKRGKKNSKNVVNVNAYYGGQNWSRFPDVVNDSYTYMSKKAEADLNEFGETQITPEELERYRVGTEPGYQSFNWKDFIIKKNAPLYSVNVSTTGGSEKINYYISGTHLKQEAVLGPEFNFERTNIQNNLDANITDRLKVGMQISGRIETTDNPGIPGADDYWLPRFAILRNRPFERPYANDNPDYLNDIGHNETNWALHNKEIGGYSTNILRTMQSNFNGEYQFGGVLEGLSVRGMYSYYIQDQVLNGHEYTYEAYTYDAENDAYNVTGGSTNPWRERRNRKIVKNVYQGQAQYKKAFGREQEHNVEGLFLVERQEERDQNQWMRSVPENNILPLMYFANLVEFNDFDGELARIGYIGKFNYNYKQKYFLEISGRQDKSWKFAPSKRTGFFPSGSIGWRMTEEDWYETIAGEDAWLTEFKLRASYGILGDDDIGIGAYDYLPGYNYNVGTAILNGEPVVSARDKGQIVDNLTWFKSKITDIGIDFALFDGKVTGSYDWFYRLRTGLRGFKYDILIPSELGYTLPDENVNSDSQAGFEGALTYNDSFGDFNVSVSANGSYSRGKFIESYKPRFSNSWQEYRASSEGRYNDMRWGYNVIGEFQTQEEINNYTVDIDGQGNRTLLPGDLIYEDINGDGRINGYDEKPIGYSFGKQPNINFGLNIRLSYKGVDMTADFSGGSGYSWIQNWETRWAFQNQGALNKIFLDSWSRQDPANPNSTWVPGKYPALRYNAGYHSNYRVSTYWMHNVTYLRARTLELGYSLPKPWLDKVGFQKARFYVNGYNLFSFDNLKKFGIDPEVNEENGLQYPQNKFVNVGVNLSI